MIGDTVCVCVSLSTHKCRYYCTCEIGDERFDLRTARNSVKQSLDSEAGSSPQGRVSQYSSTEERRDREHGVLLQWYKDTDRSSSLIILTHTHSLTH